MKNIVVLIAVINSIINLYSQESTFFDLQLKGNRDVFQVVDSINNNVTLFFSDKDKVTAIGINDKFQIIDSISAKRPESKYNEILGYNCSGKKIGLIWAKSNKKELLEQTFDFSEKKIIEKIFTLDLKKEKIISSISMNDAFYLITCHKEDLTLNFYIVKENKLEIKKVNLKQETFYNSLKKRTNIFDLFTEDLYLRNVSSNVEIINKHSLTSLKSTSAIRKLFLEDNQIIFTFDNHKDVTQCIFINLKSFDYFLKFYKNPIINSNELIFNSNSYLYDKHIFQLKTSEDQFYFTIKDFDDNLIQTHHLTKSDSLYFINTPVIQENGEFISKREFEKTSKFIRKVNNLNCGVTVRHFDNNYLITIGALSQGNPNGVSSIGGVFGLAGILVATALNPTMDSFQSFSNQKVIYAHCLFDKNLNHIDGNVPEFSFDRIRNYLDTNKELKSKTLFKFNDYYYLGFYLKNEEKYFFKKFKETIK